MLGAKEPKPPSDGYTHMPCVCLCLSYKNSENSTEIQSQLQQVFFYRNAFAYIVQISVLPSKGFDCLISEHNNCNHIS